MCLEENTFQKDVMTTLKTIMLKSLEEITPVENGEKDKLHEIPNQVH